MGGGRGERKKRKEGESDGRGEREGKEGIERERGGHHQLMLYSSLSLTTVCCIE